PAGLEAARRLALRGYSVQLYEREAAVGGQVRRWANTPSRREFFKALDWWRAELDRLRVELLLQRSPGIEELRQIRPTLVLLATGSHPLKQTIQVDGSLVPQLSPYEALDLPAGDHIVVRDEVGRLGAMLIAEQLKQRWTKVTLVTSELHPGE